MSSAGSTQAEFVSAASGNVLQDYYVGSSGPRTQFHVASAHNSTLVMNNTSGTLVIDRDGQELFRANIMGVSSLTGATPALRFTELANLLTT